MNQGISILVVSVDDYTCGPAAAAMLSKKLQERFPEVECVIDSASHIPFHKGKSVDHRMCEALKQRGYTVSHVSRPLVFDDFVDYELMLSLGGSFKMDPEDYQGSRHVQPIAKYCSLTDFLPMTGHNFISNPIYGSAADFERSVAILEDLVDEFIIYLMRNFPERLGMSA